MTATVVNRQAAAARPPEAAGSKGTAAGTRTGRVRVLGIPKPHGGIRTPGIPTVLDRFVQQAVMQVLTPAFDPGFSVHSYGFRPNRNAHDAV